MSDRPNECGKCDSYGSHVIELTGSTKPKRWWYECDECGHKGPKCWFKWTALKAWNAERSPQAKKSQEEWSEKMREIFDSEPKLSDDEEVCPECGGGAISPLGIAVGCMICMTCGGRGKVDK